MSKTQFGFDNRGNIKMDMGDTSDPKFQGPLTTDLIKKTWDDLMVAMDRNMKLAGDATDDFELEVFIKNSIMVSTSTNLVGQAVGFMIHSQSQGQMDADDLTTDVYMTRVIEHLSMVAQVLMKGHLNDRIRAGKMPVTKKPKV